MSLRSSGLLARSTPKLNFASERREQQMASPQLPPVSPYIASAFQIAKAKYNAKHVSWINLSARLAGRFSLPIAMTSLQRQGDLDLLLRCMEDEFQ
jgi:hypothetical protein